MTLHVARARASASLRRSPATVVLMYHRVSHPAHDPFGLCVSPGHFAEHLEVVRRLAEPIRLTDCRAPSRRMRVAVTFDDGYVDNLTHALPALQAADVPATIFVVSDAVGRHREFWWDELEQCFRPSWTGPRHLDVEAGGRRATGEVSADEESLRAAHAFLLALGPDAQAQALADIRAQLGVAEPLVERRAVTEDELDRLARCELIEIGAHTRRHPNLTVLDLTERDAEIQGSRSALQERLSRPLDAFTYPYGATDAETLGCAQRAGFRHAFTVFPGRVDGDSPPLAMPRCNVENWDGEEFERRLSGWLGLN
jgi:peptidoglycan/xylan/chitin deacetylase (PgdA/CDA1 family)